MVLFFVTKKLTNELFPLFRPQEKYENFLAEKDSEIEMLKDHIEVLLDEQETFNKSHHTEGTCSPVEFLTFHSMVDFQKHYFVLYKLATSVLFSCYH